MADTEREEGRRKPEEEGKDKDRKDKDREKGKKTKGRKEPPAAALVIVHEAEKLQDEVKKDPVFSDDKKKELDKKLADVKKEAKTKETKRNPIEEILDIIELSLKLSFIEDEIKETKTAEIWKELQKKVGFLDTAIGGHQISRARADSVMRDLLDKAAADKDVDRKKLQEMIIGMLKELSEEAMPPREREGDLERKFQEILAKAIEVRGGVPFDKEEEKKARLIFENIYSRRAAVFSDEEVVIIAQHQKGVKEERIAEDLVMEKVNKIFAAADTNPETDFRTAMTLEDQINLSLIHRTLLDMGEWGETISRKLTSENTLRRNLYQINYVIERGAGGVKPPKLPDAMAGMTTELRDVLFNVPGTSTCARLWERGFEKLLKNYGFVPYEKIIYLEGKSELASWVKERFIEYLKVEQKRDGWTDEQFKKAWPDWKINRAISMGKGHGLLTLRLVEIAAKGKIPEVAKRMYSPWAEDFVRTANPTEHLYGKFKMGGPGLAMLHYIMTGEKPKSLSAKELLASLKQIREQDPKKQRLFDRLNLVAAGGPLTQSSWRGVMDAAHIPGETAEELYSLGTNLSLILLSDRLEDKPAEKESQIREVWKKALKRDALQIIREAEIYNEALEPILRHILGSDYHKDYFNQIAKFHPDERMKQLVLLDYLKATETDWQAKWQDLGRFPDDLKSWERMKMLQAKDEFFDKIENHYLLCQEAAVAQTETLGRYIELDTVILEEPWRQKVDKYLESIDKIAKFKYSPKASILENLVEKSLGGGFRLGLGNSDAAWKALRFSNEGHIALHRRYRDFGAAGEAVGMIAQIMEKFAEYQKKPLAFAEDVRALHMKIKEYDPNAASEVCSQLLEGFIRACDGDIWIKYLPFPFDRIVNTFFRNSYAEKTLGEAAHAFTAIDKRNLIKHFHELGMFFTPTDVTGHHKAMELFEKLKADRRHIFLEFILKYGPIGILFFIWQLKEEYEEKVEKAIGG